MTDVRAAIERAAAAPSTVLVEGGSGAQLAIEFRCCYLRSSRPDDDGSGVHVGWAGVPELRVWHVRNIRLECPF